MSRNRRLERRSFNDIELGLTFEDKELRSLLEQLAGLVGQGMEVSEDGTSALKTGTRRRLRQPRKAAS